MLGTSVVLSGSYHKVREQKRKYDGDDASTFYLFDIRAWTITYQDCFGVHELYTLNLKPYTPDSIEPTNPKAPCTHIVDT